MTLRELLGEEASVAADQASVHVGAALQAAARARQARTGRALAQAELAAVDRAGKVEG